MPSTVHCDHLIQARVGADADMQVALDANREVYEFLRTRVGEVRHRLLEAGRGIIHQVVLENYAFPGGMMIGTDSHTPNAGGLGMFAIGVGGADAVDVMAGWPYNIRVPKLIGVQLTGALSGWAAPKDVILEGRRHPHREGRHRRDRRVLRPGRGVDLGTGKATICNMGAEIGATSSIFPYDEHMAKYLKATGREAIADLADAHAEHLRNDPEVDADPERFFDRVIEIDLVDARAAPRRAAHARPRPADLARSPPTAASEGYPREISRRAGRLVHELLVRGHRPRRARRAPGDGARA